MDEMNNSVEKLRAILYTAGDLQNSEGEFSELDIKFMEQFKRIYELGGDQVSIFMDMLNEGGYKLSVYTIMYYVDLLKNGPMRDFFYQYRGNKRYYYPLPDVMGTVSNINKSPANTSIIAGDVVESGCSVEILRKLPPYMQNELNIAIPECERMFRTCFDSCTIHDNTLPLVDKMPEARFNTEPSGKWSLVANANFMVKDVDFYNIIASANSEVLFAVWEYIAKYQKNDKLFAPDLTPPEGTGPGEENWRVWWTLRNYNPYNVEENTSTSGNYIQEKSITENGKSVQMKLDLFGDEIASYDNLGSTLKIYGDEKDVEYKLYTNKGQLGS